jgi:hypothetical protein
MSQMITEYCSSSGGFIVTSMILALKGEAQQHGRLAFGFLSSRLKQISYPLTPRTGLTVEAKIGIASAIGSAVVTALFSTCAWKVISRRKRR